MSTNLYDEGDLSCSFGSNRAGCAYAHSGNFLAQTPDHQSQIHTAEYQYDWEREYNIKDQKLSGSRHFPYPCMVNRVPCFRGGFNPSGNNKSFEKDVASGKIWVFNLINEKFYRVDFMKINSPNDIEYHKYFKQLIDSKVFVINKGLFLKNGDEVPNGKVRDIK